MEDNKVMPILAVRGLTAFPNVLLHLDVGRSISMKAIDKAMKDGQIIFITAQKDINVDKPTFDDIYKIGTICKIKQILKLPSEDVRVLVQGISRGVILEPVKSKPYFAGAIGSLPDFKEVLEEKHKIALARTMVDTFEQYLLVQRKVSGDILSAVMVKTEPSEIADFIAQNIPIDNSKKQFFLEERDAFKRCISLIETLEKEIEILDIESEIAGKVREKLDKNQREYYLKEQLKIVLKELGEDDNFLEDFNNYLEKIKKLKLDEKTEEKLNSEARKMRRLGPNSQEGAVIRNYLDFVLNLPFEKQTKDKLDIEKATKILDENHYGLDKVKERILETLALRKVSENDKGTVICLLGPPGVGKTSIASSIAKSLGRKMARVSLGGVRDESDIRGHRKTYVGAMSGKIIRAINDAKTKNPVILLDEIDKMSSDMRGDPSAAMLEVLDFEQNETFFDHYVDIPFDLSKVIFIATANNLSNVSKPLLDRMEIIELGSYTSKEKFSIAKDHIIPKITKKYKLKNLKISDNATENIIKKYTRESGVRRLEQQIEKICRKAAFNMVSNDVKTVKIDTNLEDFLGKEVYIDDYFLKENEIGIVNGLAYTTVGGSILSVEVNIVSGDGKLQLTGNLGDVMKESAQIALSYIRSISDKLGLEEDFYKKNDIHIHFPEGAVPKDGPSAGITMATAIISALTKTKVDSSVAMTGEISLRGNVMPIGGLKEKTMAAYQYGIKKVIISKENERDLSELDKEITENIEFVIAKNMQTVLKHTLISDIDLSMQAEQIINGLA